MTGVDLQMPSIASVLKKKLLGEGYRFKHLYLHLYLYYGELITRNNKKGIPAKRYLIPSLLMLVIITVGFCVKLVNKFITQPLI